MQEKYDRQQMQHYINNSQGIISACSVTVKEQCIKRYDRVCAQLHLSYARKWGEKLENKHWQKHVPKLTETNHAGTVTVSRSQQVQTDKTIPNNKPAS
jgi:hypothetical protein